MADPIITNPEAKGSSTSEGKLAIIATILSILATIVPTLITMLTDLQARFPSWSWAGPVLGILGVVGTVLTAIGYGKARTEVKVAMINAGTVPESAALPPKQG